MPTIASAPPLFSSPQWPFNSSQYARNRLQTLRLRRARPEEMRWSFHAILPHKLLGALLRTSFKTKSARDEPQSSSKSLNLPPSPREFRQHREHYEIPILERRVDHDSDTPSAVLYRIYEHTVLDKSIEIRNELETFWFHSSWKVSKIPDPKDLIRSGVLA